MSEDVGTMHLSRGCCGVSMMSSDRLSTATLYLGSSITSLMAARSVGASKLCQSCSKPKPFATASATFMCWSAAMGMPTMGVLWQMVSWMLPAPPWVRKRTTLGWARRSCWGSQEETSTFGGASGIATSHFQITFCLSWANTERSSCRFASGILDDLMTEPKDT